MSSADLSPDQDKNACQQRQKASDDTDPKSGESHYSNRDKVDCKQKHTDIFRNHVVSILLRVSVPSTIFPRSE